VTVRSKTLLDAAVPGRFPSNSTRSPMGIGPIHYTLIGDTIDTLFARAPKQSVACATAAALAAYTRVGATITANANGLLGAIDGVTPTAGQRLLLKNGAAGADNGIYVVTSVGAAGARYVLTRADDFTTGDAVAGALVIVQAGTANGDRFFYCTNDSGADIVGTNAITWAEVSASVTHDSTIGMAASTGHTSFPLLNGTRPFTGAIEGVAGATDASLATKGYVDAAIEGLDWQESVISSLDTPPGAPALGARYRVIAVAMGAWATHEDEIAVATAIGWDFIVPDEGFALRDENTNLSLVYNGAAWVGLGTSLDHGDMVGLADDDHTQYSLVAGTRAFTGAVAGVEGAAPASLTTRANVESRRLMPPARAVATAALPAYTITGAGAILTEDVANAGFPALDGAIVVAAGELFWHTSGAAPTDNGPWILVDAGGALDVFVAHRPPGFVVGDDIGGVHGYVREGAVFGGTMVEVLEAGGIVGTDAVTVQYQHGLLADGRAEYHDTSQIENLSAYGGADATAALTLIRAQLGTRTGFPAGLQTSDGAGLANDLYTVDYTEGLLIVGCVPELIPLGNDVVLVGAGAGAIPCYDLAGGAAAVITANDRDRELALCSILVAGVPTLYGVFGAEAGTGLAVAPTSAQIRAALIAAAIVGSDTTCGVIWSRILFARAGGGPGATSCTHRDVLTYAALAEERAVGTLHA
jgi:hypothetical protein